MFRLAKSCRDSTVRLLLNIDDSLADRKSRGAHVQALPYASVDTLIQHQVDLAGAPFKLAPEDGH